MTLACQFPRAGELRRCSIPQSPFGSKAIIAAMNCAPRLWGEPLVVFLKATAAKIDAAAAAISKHRQQDTKSRGTLADLA
jgi:hypothetical protein